MIIISKLDFLVTFFFTTVYFLTSICIWLFSHAHSFCFFNSEAKLSLVLTKEVLWANIILVLKQAQRTLIKYLLEKKSVEIHIICAYAEESGKGRCVGHFWGFQNPIWSGWQLWPFICISIRRSLIVCRSLNNYLGSPFEINICWQDRNLGRHNWSHSING